MGESVFEWKTDDALIDIVERQSLERFAVKSIHVKQISVLVVNLHFANVSL